MLGECQRFQRLALCLHGIPACHAVSAQRQMVFGLLEVLLGLTEFRRCVLFGASVARDGNCLSGIAHFLYGRRRLAGSDDGEQGKCDRKLPNSPISTPPKLA